MALTNETIGGINSTQWRPIEGAHNPHAWPALDAEGD
jgi:hypothetical protein